MVISRNLPPLAFLAAEKVPSSFLDLRYGGICNDCFDIITYARSKNALLDTIERNDINWLEKILKFKPELIFLSDRRGQTSMYVAAREGNVAAIRYLHILHPNFISSEGIQLVNIAAEKCHLEAIRTLYELSPPDLISQQDRCDRNPMHYAVTNWFFFYYGDKERFERTIKTLHELNPNFITMQDMRGETPMHMAAKCNNAVGIRMLHDMNSTVIAMQDREGNTPMHTAASRCHIAAIKVLYELDNSLIYKKDIGGFTPLDQAKEYKHEKAIIKITKLHQMERKKALIRTIISILPYVAVISSVAIGCFLKFCRNDKYS